MLAPHLFQDDFQGSIRKGSAFDVGGEVFHAAMSFPGLTYLGGTDYLQRDA